MNLLNNLGKYNIINSVYNAESKILIKIIFASLITVSLFSLRWINCLPFSGYSPLPSDWDNVGILGRYLVYVKEPLNWPLGLIANLGFPFYNANISQDSIPLFAILFKFLSKIYPPLSDYSFFVLYEITAVFFTCFIACMILRRYNINKFHLYLFCSILIGLNTPLLYRTKYWGISYFLGCFPSYLFFSYSFLCLYQNPKIRYIIFISLSFLIVSLINYYFLFSIIFLTSALLFFQIINSLWNYTQINHKRLLYIFNSLILGITLSYIALAVVGNQGNLSNDALDNSPFSNRYAVGWGYGGGFGGGFHVADVFSVIIPPNDSDPSLPEYKTLGPRTYLSNIGFPITTNDLQDGQYEGFAYIGTTSILIIFISIMVRLFSFIAGGEKSFYKTNLRMKAVCYIKYELISFPLIMGISTISLYVMSWGYIIHCFGIRLNNIVTPSLLLAEVWPKFMFARSLGRLAIPFSIFLIMFAILSCCKHLEVIKYKNKTAKILSILIIIFLCGFHLTEIRGYLIPGESTRGNGITNYLSLEEKRKIGNITKNCSAIMVYPKFRDNIEWSTICYNLAIYSGKRVSGATLSLGTVSPNQASNYNTDIQLMENGKISKLYSKYGNIIIASPLEKANNIMRKSDISLKKHIIRPNKLALLTLNNNLTN